jgi:Domain of unknown function (DUF5916)
MLAFTSPATASSRMLTPLLLAAAIAAPPAHGRVYVGRTGDVHVEIPRIDTTVAVDGTLDAPVWSRAALLTGFSEFSPQDGVPAPDSTEVLLWYSPQALYVGIRAYESDGGVVHATHADRDNISSDDNVQILLGTFRDRQRAYLLAVNPFGVQMDGTIVESGQSQSAGWTRTLSGRVAPDLSQDFVFTSQGHLTPWGYEVELRIPFRSLKYQSAATQSWALNVVRDVQHSGFEDSWAPARRSAASFLAQSGTIDGLTGLARGLVLDLNPVVTEKITGAPAVGRSGWTYAHASPAVGGNLRWGVTNNLTLNGTVKPDFAEVESDAEQVVLDPRDALYYPEKRPFFLDGLDQFGVPNNLIYTRRIAAPDGALKLTGGVGSTRIGVLSAVDAPGASATGRTLYNILRTQQDLPGGSQLGMAYTDRESSAALNRVLDVDGRLIFGGVYSQTFQAAESFDRTNGVRRDAPLLAATFARNGKRFGFRYSFNSIGDDFRAGSGFISRAGVVSATVDHRATWFGAPGALIETLTGNLTVNGTWKYTRFVRRDDAEDKRFQVTTSVGLHGGWTVGAGVYWETFGYDPALYANYRILAPTGDTLAFTGTPRILNRDYVTTLVTPQWKHLDVNAVYIFGQDENFYEWAQANIDYAALTVNVRPTTRLRLEGTLAYQDYWRRTDHSLVARNSIPRLKVEYQLTRSIFVRLVSQYSVSETSDLRDESRTGYPLIVGGAPALATRSRTLTGQYLFSYQPNPGTVLFLGYGNESDGLPNAAARFTWQPLLRTSDYIFVKASYLFGV